MTLTVPQQVRLRIQDRPRYGQEVQAGDGLSTLFKLAQGSPFSTLSAISAYVPAAAGWSATGATFDTSLGIATFSAAISAGSSVRVDYQWSVFSDDEIGQFTAAGGSVAGAALEAVKTLLFDSLKRARWGAPDGTNYDDTQAQAQLAKMYSALWYELRETPEGGIESWGQQQAYYSNEYNA